MVENTQKIMQNDDRGLLNTNLTIPTLILAGITKKIRKNWKNPKIRRNSSFSRISLSWKRKNTGVNLVSWSTWIGSKIITFGRKHTKNNAKWRQGSLENESNNIWSYTSSVFGISMKTWKKTPKMICTLKTVYNM